MQSWLHSLTQNTSLFLLGEYMLPLDVLAERLRGGALDSSFNFPLYYTTIDVFTAKAPMSDLPQAIHKVRAWGRCVTSLHTSQQVACSTTKVAY